MTPELGVHDHHAVGLHAPGETGCERGVDGHQERVLGDPRQQGHDLIEGRASSQHHRWHAVEESLEVAHAGGCEEGAEVRGEIPYPQPAEPGECVGIDLPTKLERLDRALGGTAGFLDEPAPPHPGTAEDRPPVSGIAQRDDQPGARQRPGQHHKRPRL